MSDKYTDPKLRDEVKKEVHNSDKGGKPGQWSARKAQMMASEYKKRGGGYNTTKEEGQTEPQKHLENWTKEEWQTKEGSGTARQDDDSRKRYLPKKAWDQLSEKEKEETDEKKVEESQGGKQFVGNTTKAKEARRKVSSDVRDDGDVGDDDAGEDDAGEGDAGEDDAGEGDARKGDAGEGDEVEDDAGEGDEVEDDEAGAEAGEEGQKGQKGQKDSKKARETGEAGHKGTTKTEEKTDDKESGTGTKRSAKQDASPNKKQKDSARMQSLRKRA